MAPADTPQLTKLGSLMLRLLRESEKEWVTRLDLAALLGRPDRIVPHDIRTLNGLIELGLVEVREVEVGSVKTEFQYRAVR